MSLERVERLMVVCDFCGKTVMPDPALGGEGWTKGGSDHGPGTEKIEWYACPECSERMRP